MKRWILLWLIATPVFGGRWTLQIGPPGVGTGGTNPVSIPPVQIQEYDVVYLTKTGRELSLSIFPGILYGQRTTFGATYLSMGGGLGIQVQGVGPGFYTAFGFDKPCMGTTCFHMEYKAALILLMGEGKPRLVSSYALRAGVSLDL